jgi:predicted nucleic acid-binding Zn ribbon protein
MPIFSYRCVNEDCDVEVLDFLEKEPEDHYCAKCASPLVRTIAKGAIPKFKGSGFHVNDYRK